MYTFCCLLFCLSSPSFLSSSCSSYSSFSSLFPSSPLFLSSFRFSITSFPSFSDLSFPPLSTIHTSLYPSCPLLISLSPSISPISIHFPHMILSPFPPPLPFHRLLLRNHPPTRNEDCVCQLCAQCPKPTSQTVTLKSVNTHVDYVVGDRYRI